MKYKEGNIVVLMDRKTVYIMAINEKERKYKVFDTENDQDVFEIDENEIIMKC